MAKLTVCKCCHGAVSDEADTCPHCGQPEPGKDMRGWETEARLLISQGKMINAIKLVREKTGLGLKGRKIWSSRGPVEALNVAVTAGR
jgi:ribosomal protein L7/L12